MEKIVKILNYSSLIALIIGIGVGLFYFKRLEKYFLFIWGYLLLGFIFHISGKVFAELFKNNLILMPILGGANLTLFSFFFIDLIKSKRLKKVILITALGGLSFIIYEVVVINVYEVINLQFYGLALAGFLIVCYGLLYLYERFSEGMKKLDQKIRLVGLIIAFFSINLSVMLPMNFLINAAERTPLIFIFWIVNSLIISLFYFALSIELWKNGKTPKF